MLWSRCQNYLRPGAGAELILINTAVFTAVSLEVASSVADPERFNADPDPTFQADAAPDPDPNPFTRVINFFSSNLQLLFPKSSKLVMCNFSARMRKEG